MDRAEHREQLLRMAEAWETMAEQREALLGDLEGSFDAF